MGGPSAMAVEREIADLADAAHHDEPASYRMRALASLDRLVGVDVGMLWTTTDLSAPLAARGISAEAAGVIGRRHAAFAPIVARLLAAAQAAGGVVLDGRVFSAREMADLPLYAELGRCLGLRQHMTVRLAFRGHVVGGAYLGRAGARARSFTDDDIARVRRLLPVMSLAEATPHDLEAGASALTDKEREVLELFAVGATYSEVGRALGVSINTIRQHVRAIYDKLGVASKTEAVLRVR